MNILLMTDKLITGGAETYFCRLENELQHTDITFYTAAGNGELYEKLKHKERFTAMSRNNHLRNIRDLSKHVLTHDIDVIHANSLRMVLYAILIKKLTRRNIRIIYTKHNVTVLEGRYKFALSALLNRYVNRIITVSDYEKNNLIRLGVRESIITTIYNGVDLQQFSFSGKQEHAVRKIGILARLSEEKNHDLFLKIACELDRTQPNSFEFYIGGDGPKRSSIITKIEELGLSDNVCMLGEIKQPEQFMREMDVLLLTSYREVFPMVILEAMATGTPVVSIDTDGIKEAIVEGQTGFLVPHYSEKEFAEKILFLCSDLQLHKQIAEKSRQMVQARFSLNLMVESTLHEYIKCCT